MRRPCLVAILCLSSLINSGAASQQPIRLGVFVSLSGEDTVGQNLAYALREELRRSAGYDLATEQTAVFTINLVTLDLALPGEPRGSSSAVAVAHTMKNYLPFDQSNPQTWYPIFLTVTNHTVGRNRVESQAKVIIASLDQEVQTFRSFIR